MSQNPDKNKIRDSIQKARLQNLLYVFVDQTDKDSKKKTLNEIDKFIGNGSYQAIFIRL